MTIIDSEGLVELGGVLFVLLGIIFLDLNIASSMAFAEVNV